MSSIKSYNNGKLTAKSITAQYFRWVISATKAVGPMQISEISFLKDGTRVSYTGATAVSSQGDVATAIASYAIDNNSSTKWFANSTPVSLAITFQTPISMNQYQFTTGDDSPNRDPTDWILYYSIDNLTWTVFSSITSYAMTGSRLIVTPIINVY